MTTNAESAAVLSARKWLTRTQAADYLGLAEKTLKNMATLGDGPRYHRPSHKHVLYATADLDAWVVGGQAGGRLH